MSFDQTPKQDHNSEKSQHYHEDLGLSFQQVLLEHINS